MAKRGGSSPDALLDHLSALRQAPSSPEFAAELRKALAHASPVLVARAAELCGRHGRAELAGDLVAAFRRFADTKARDDDRQYAARTAVARALVDLKAVDADAEAVYLRGLEAAGRGVTSLMNDSAAELRAACAFGLAQANPRRAAAACTDLLADPAPLVRVAAARALAATGREAAALVLRLKLQLGDRDPEVLAESVTGMVALAPAESLDAAGRALHHEDKGVRAAAAVAIGTSRLPEAVGLLQRAFVREPDAVVRRTILIAAASTRTSTAVDWLIELATTGEPGVAAHAVEALGPYRLDESVKRRMVEGVAVRGDARLTDAVRRVFG